MFGKQNSENRSGTQRMPYQRLLATEDNVAVVEQRLREMIDFLSRGQKNEFIQSAISDNGRIARQKLLEGQIIPQSPIRQKLHEAEQSAKIIQNLEQTTARELTAYVQETSVERSRRDNERETVAQQLQVLWGSEYLNKDYVQQLQDDFDTYYLLPNEAEQRKSHIGEKPFKAVASFMDMVPFQGDTLLLLEDQRRAVVGFPKESEGDKTTYGSLAAVIGPITTSGKFEGKLMHPGQLEMALVSYGNTLFDFIQNETNYPKGNRERELWQKVRNYVNATDEDSNEFVLVKFQEKIKKAFSNSLERLEDLKPSLLYLPFSGRTFSPLLNRLAVSCERVSQRLIRQRKTISEITVDNPEAQLLEDAFWVERLPDGGFKVDISVGDIASLLQGKYDMILEAIRRREVNYTEEGRIAMLPQPLQNTLNLKAGKTHPAVTFTITFHDGYMTPSLDMHLTAVHIDYNLTYDMADLLYMGNKNVAPMLQDADVLAQRLAEHRRRRWERIQAIDGKDPGNISARIVAEFMTLLNTLVGKYMSKKPGTPALYLEHSASVEGHRYSRYTTDPLSAYKGKAIARVTSPVRSADSMINHIQLLAKVFKQGEAFSAEQLQEICDYLNEPYDALAQQ